MRFMMENRTALGEEARHWGRYYEHEPVVLAGHLPQALRHLAQARHPLAGAEQPAAALAALPHRPQPGQDATWAHATPAGAPTPSQGAANGEVSSPGILQIDDGVRRWHTAELAQQVDQFAVLLRQRRVRVLATVMDNCAAWVAADQAATKGGVVHVPLPPFFTPAQVAHALQAAGASHMLAPAGAWQGSGEAVGLAGSVLQLSPLPAPPG
eukprot:gene63904-87401_t